MISIIIPVYNAEKFLERCLSSVLGQTYENIEVIAVNDGSTDHSLKIMQQYADKDTRIKIISQENAGVSAARNAGLEICEGEFIIFIDSDDWIESNMLEILLRNLQANRADISCCQYDHGDVNIDRCEMWNRNEAIKRFLIHKQLNGSLVNKVFSRKSISGKRLDCTIKYGEDALFLWEVLLGVDSIVVSDEVLYHVTLHDDSATGGGSYKPIRRDCLRVWSAIAEDARLISAEFESMARAQLANMAFFSIYAMAYYGYRDKADEHRFKQVLKEHFADFLHACFISKGVKVLAGLTLVCAGFARMLIYARARIRR